MSQAYDNLKKDISRQSVRDKGALSLKTILNDPVNLKYFKQFCIQEMSVENLLFTLEVEDYKDPAHPSEYRRFLARKIIKKYIQEDATMGLAVKHDIRQAITSSYDPSSGEAPPADVFDKQLQEVELSMKQDIIPRFIESSLADELLKLKYEERKVVSMEEFDLYRFLGAGGFGMVLLAKQRNAQKNVERFFAIKVMDKRILLSQNQTHSIFREKEVLACVEHPFIIALRYAFQTEDHLCLVLDYIEGGNMYSDLMRGPYTHERACFYAAQIVLATQHLHELDILYRDLKPDNVLLTIEGNVKLADMGAARGISDDGTIDGGESGTSTSDKTAKKVDPNKGRRMTITGTHGYRAPEVYARDYGKAEVEGPPFKIIIVGDSGVGKTCLLLRFTEGRYDGQQAATVSVDISNAVLDLGSSTVGLALWDTAGQERFASLSAPYFRQADGVVLVFDLTNRASFERLSTYWLDEIHYKADPEVSILLIGAKADLPAAKRQVTSAEAREYAESQGWMYFETSAMLGTHVRDAFYLLACTVMNRLLEADPKNLINARGKAGGIPMAPKGTKGREKGGCC